MSADFEVFCMGLFCGMMGTLMMIGAFAYVDFKVTKRKLDKFRDSDGDPDVDSGRDRIDRIYYYDYSEEVINGLQNIRMSLSRTEREYLDYACECVLMNKKGYDKNDYNKNR